MTPPTAVPTKPSQPSTVAHTDKAEPWKKWLAEVMEASNHKTGEDSIGSPWDSCKPNPQDPSEEPWVCWRNLKNSPTNGAQAPNDADDDDDDDDDEDDEDDEDDDDDDD